MEIKLQEEAKNAWLRINAIKAKETRLTPIQKLDLFF
jgi:hypothetical protein